MKPLNIFYEEPEGDRWLPLDRYPRRVIRRLVHGKPRIGGQKRVFLNLCAGLNQLNLSYRVNDYRYIKQHPEEVACIVGKPHILDKIKWENPILFGAAVFSHPCDDPKLLERLPVRRILVPGEWMRKMCEPYYGKQVITWPVGIDTDTWKPVPTECKDIDILLYDKVRWKHESYEKELIAPIQSYLKQRSLKTAVIRYSFYREEEFRSLVARSRGMVFLCEHETQGIAYQQTLACGVPILAWDRGGYWQDPCYFPKKVQFAPVSSVPYWNDGCGIKFKDINEFSIKIEEFLENLRLKKFSPRNYILENLTLKKCAKNYLEILEKVQSYEQNS